MKKTTKSQTKPSVNWEAVRVLAIELGAREAARRMSIKESTVLSRAFRERWNLPKRKGGATKASANAITLQSKPGDVLIATHKELETKTKTALMQTAAKAAQRVAQKPPLDVDNIAQLRDLAAATARLFGWDVREPAVTVYSDKTMIVCDEKRRAELIQQRERLLAGEAEVETAAPPAALPAQETQPDANVGAGNATVAQDQSPNAQKDQAYQHMQSIGRAETWKTSEPEHHAGMFGPYPEEFE